MLKQRSLLAALFGFAVLVVAPAAMALSIEAVATPFEGDDTEVKIVLTESGGDIIVTLDVVKNHADLRAVYFNIADDSLLDGISVTGDDVTDFETHTSNLGPGTNLVGTGNPCPCDFGVELGIQGSGGEQGRGPDYIESTSFVISHNTLDLLIEQFAEQVAGIRATGVGPEVCFDGSAKLSLTLPVAVPEPASALLVGIGLALLGARSRRR